MGVALFLRRWQSSPSSPHRFDNVSRNMVIIATVYRVIIGILTVEFRNESLRDGWVVGSISGSSFFSCNWASSGIGGVWVSVARSEPAVGEIDSSASVDWFTLVLCVEADKSGVGADEAGEEVDEAGECAGVVDVVLHSCPELFVVISVVLVRTVVSLRMNLFFLVGFDGALITAADW